jgi:signal transduction histidine kinase
LATEKSADGATLRITDTGCGMPPAVLQQIFEPFFTTKAPGKGTGLGLYNVKTIVAKMRGKIDVESRVGKGTTFTINFPALTEHET